MSLNHLGPLAELTYLDKTIRFLEIICVEFVKGVCFHTEVHISDKYKSRLPYNEEETIPEKNLKNVLARKPGRKSCYFSPILS